MYVPICNVIRLSQPPLGFSTADGVVLTRWRLVVNKAMLHLIALA